MLFSKNKENKSSVCSKYLCDKDNNINNFQMKKVFLIFILFVTVQICFAQNEFAPVGAKWYYSKGFCITPPEYCRESFLTIESIGDTLINGKLCKILTQKGTSCPSIDPYMYVYSDNGRVFWYIPSINDFTMLYDFTLNAGDSWKMISLGSTDTCLIIFTVDSVSSMVINNDTLKVLFTNSTWLWTRGGKIVEKIGHLDYLIPWYYMCPASNPVDCMGPLTESPKGLRCYEDSTLGFYQRCDSISCDTIYYVYTGKSETENDHCQILCYPTIVTDELIIESDCEDFITLVPTTYQIYNLIGQRVLSDNIDKHKKIVHFNNLTPGIYFVNISFNTEQKTFKFIKIKKDEN